MAERVGDRRSLVCAWILFGAGVLLFGVSLALFLAHARLHRQVIAMGRVTDQRRHAVLFYWTAASATAGMLVWLGGVMLATNAAKKGCPKVKSMKKDGWDDLA